MVGVNVLINQQNNQHLLVVYAYQQMPQNESLLSSFLAAFSFSSALE
jgi:hypothetical protein